MLTTVVSMWLSGAALLGLALYAKRAARAQVHARASGRGARSRRGAVGH